MALTDITTTATATGLRPRLRAWLASEHGAAQRVAGTAFVIRVTGAVVIFLSQILLARWMGASEFGIYIYAWTWLQLVGDIIHLGLPLSAQRAIPEYTQKNEMSGLRGFIVGSRWMVFASATSMALIGAVLVHWLTPTLDHGTVMPLYLACVALPFYSLTHILDATARAYNAIGTALLPPFVLRPLLLIAAMAAADAAGLTRDATTGMAAFAAATWATSLLQLVLLRRCIRHNVPAGPRSYHVAAWLKSSAPMFAVWASYMLLLYVDVLVLRQFQPPDVVAHYYAASKTLALVAFIHFAVSAAVAHRFAAHHVAGNHEALTELARSTVRWTFWPSLLAIAGVLALGKPILWLFGPGFGDAYPLMFVLAIALLARAAVGPAERVLNMLGEQNRCALVYAGMFAFNLVGCLAVAGPYGSAGVAWVIATGATIEAALLFLLAKRQLGLHMLIGR